MKATTAIITFCYLYIVGIAVALLVPVDPGFTSYPLAASALALLAAGLLYVAPAIMPGWPRRPRRIAALLLFAGLMLGYGRYLGANVQPDMRLGEIRADATSRTLVIERPLSDTSRIRLVPASAPDTSIRLRLHGELDARQAVTNASGQAVLDADGRWTFRITRLPIASEEVVLPAGATDSVVVEQPFTRITRVEWIDGPASARIRVFRISNHIGSFVQGGRNPPPVTVLGRISSDPRVYDFKTVLIITPDYIQFPAGGPYYRVEGGDMQVTVPTNLVGYTDVAATRAYGADVQIRGGLSVARAEANPGGFDARTFMRNYNIHALMNLRQERGEAPPLAMIGPAGGPPRTGDPLVAFSLQLRDDMLRQFKHSMPYPQSAFLGGVTLGLRYGLQGVAWPGDGLDHPWAPALGLGPSEALIADDFRASGVNHVLAVSGLHVTIITAMFIGVFGLLRFPRTVFVPLVILALVVFAIITGARPSTLRAVIMNSLFLLTWAYLDRSLLSSVMLGVPVAAFLILLHNPLVVVDPSFTLSFGAILSLALLTMPVHEQLARLRGNRLAAVILFVTASTLIGVARWALITEPTFLVPWLALGVAVFALAAALDRQGIGIPPRFAFSAMPESVSTFLAAQVAIQVGMMIPLSAYYFCRWPFGGAYANLIAIPLIGVVVQLGAIAGLLGLIPVIGPWLALVLNAANWLFTTFFLWLAHVFALAFPYPVVTRPRVIDVVVYYALLAMWIWRKPLGVWLGRLAMRAGWEHPRATVSLWSLLIGLTLVPLAVAPPRVDRPDGLQVTVLSVGYGSSVLIESPGGRNILVDSGFVEHDRARRNEADRTILPFLASHGALRLDGLILTSPLPERSAGMATLLDHLRIDALVLPPALEGLSTAWTSRMLEERLGTRHERHAAIQAALVGNPQWPRRGSLAASLADRRATTVNRWAGWYAPVQVARPGTVLFEEQHGGNRFAVEVLGPEAPVVSDRPVEDASVALRVVYGEVALLLPGMRHYAGQAALATSAAPDALRAQVLLAPHHGAAVPGRADRPARADVEAALARATGPLLDVVRPERVVFEFGNPRPVLGDAGRSVPGVFDITRAWYAARLGEEAILSTDRDLAVIIRTDGVTYTIDTQALRNRAEGGEEDAVSDLAVGL
ncbi:MAG TPA: ComEC/Rec2 family competence protein [Kiritimatiellia bacterium]|nr:ComEC/Rec2 family competence protein [Kiritimatiellia bacterium]HMP33882.1 ComEC/Rec2 family competence protein [Kiritimatiellia bacterium]